MRVKVRFTFEVDSEYEFTEEMVREYFEDILPKALESTKESVMGIKVTEMKK